jgi:hypothetical protein
MNKKELQAGTKDDKRTTADNSSSASLEQNGLLSDAVQEGNKLIAKFMGGKTWNNDIFLFPVGESPLEHQSEMAKYFKYHSSWDWLMPVVEKINEIFAPLTTPLIVTTAGVFLTKIHNAICEVDIKLAHSEIVSALKWYNAQNNKST